MNQEITPEELWVSQYGSSLINKLEELKQARTTIKGSIETYIKELEQIEKDIASINGQLTASRVIFDMLKQADSQEEAIPQQESE